MRPDLSNLVSQGIKIIKSNAPEIFAGVGVVGVVSTGYLAAKGAFRAKTIIDHEESITGTSSDPKQRLKERAKLTWRCYIPAGVSGVATVGAIVISRKISSQRTAAAITAYTLAERTLSEYKGKVVEQLGENREQAIRSEIAQEKISNNPTNGRVISVIPGGNVLCCDLRSMRYFRSDMEALRKAENEINFQIVHERYVSLSEFYIILGLEITPESVYLGWTSDRLMELDVIPTLADDHEPCLSFTFNYCAPLHDGPLPEDPPCNQ